MTHWNPGKGGDFREWRIPRIPPPPPPQKKACTFGSRLGNRSVFILDPRLMFMFCFLLLFQPGHLAIPEAYTRPPDLLPHRTDLTIQDTVSSLHSLAAYWFSTGITFLRPVRIHCLSWETKLIIVLPWELEFPLGVKNSGDFSLGTVKKKKRILQSWTVVHLTKVH